MKLNFKVEGQSIICLNREVLAAEAVNFVWAAFIFDEDWMGLSKTAYFENISTGVNIAQVLSASGECKVPYEVLAQPGRLSVTVRGVSGTSGEDDYIRATVARMHPLEIRRTGTAEADNAGEATPSLVEQITAAASEAQEIAEELSQSAQNGDFDGKSIEYGWFKADDGSMSVLGIRQEGETSYSKANLRGPAGFIIKDIYASIEDLKMAHPTGQDGDAYAVGTSENNEIYIWAVDNWKSIGSLSNVIEGAGITVMEGWTLQQGETVLGNVTGYYVQSGSFILAWGRGGGQLDKVAASVVINLPEVLGNVTWAIGQVSTAATTIQGDSYIITAPASGMSAGNKVWITTAAATPGGQFTPSNWLDVTAFWFVAVTDAETPQAGLFGSQDGVNYTEGDNISIINGAISVTTTDEAIEGDTRPITSGGVYNVVGNIEALLETI